MINLKFNKSKIFNIAIFSLIAIFFIIDRALKSLAIKNKEGFDILGDFLRFRFVANENIAFSIPLGGNFLFYFLSLILIVIFIYTVFLFIKKRSKEFLLFLALFLGALSNFIDRINYSFVVDYLDLKYFTVFNLADILIFFASLFLFIFYFKEK
ncbi:MAG: signal peptidase II [Patescibacteria group bacterium]